MKKALLATALLASFSGSAMASFGTFADAGEEHFVEFTHVTTSTCGISIDSTNNGIHFGETTAEKRAIVHGFSNKPGVNNIEVTGFLPIDERLQDIAVGGGYIGFGLYGTDLPSGSTEEQFVKTIAHDESFKFGVQAFANRDDFQEGTARVVATLNVKCL